MLMRKEVLKACQARRWLVMPLGCCDRSGDASDGLTAGEINNAMSDEDTDEFITCTDGSEDEESDVDMECGSGFELARSVASRNLGRAIAPGTRDHTDVFDFLSWKCLGDANGARRTHSGGQHAALSCVVRCHHDIRFVVSDCYPIAANHTNYHEALPEFMRQDGEHYVPQDKRWNVNFLRVRGHACVTRSCVVAEASTLHILAVYTAGDYVERALQFSFRKVHAAATRSGFLARKSIHVIGSARTNYKGVKPEYYVKTLTASSADRDVLQVAAYKLTELERSLSPALYAFKLQNVSNIHPGLLPGFPATQCNAFMMGVSKGYASAPHRDKSAVELIGWDMRDARSIGPEGLGFSLYSCRIVLSLSAHRKASVLVAGDVVHGTLCPPRPHQHRAIGIVLSQKANMLTPASKEHLSILRHDPAAVFSKG
ncbi:hypothetical protein JKP88DRAFT_244958 [Tribonema minus]|uniref:Uncharacterized protein n=1 Tax=Tribonema minus TaxID=303371 RepID=A0A835Z1U6_9STRA|nr:hypothetical protein JKP88DRAFT_244958 [Tribonema minus]